MSPKSTDPDVSRDKIVHKETTNQPVNNQFHDKKEPPKKASKLKKIIILSVLVIVVITLLGNLLIFIIFSGGMSNVVRSSIAAPDVDSPSFIDKKTQARDNIQKLFTQLETITNLKSYGSSSKDDCVEGQNNYKVQTGYAHKCTYRTSTFYGINNDFRQKMLDFEKQILSDGWKDPDSPGCTHCTINDVIKNYYDDPERTQGNPQYLPPEPDTYRKDDYSLDVMYGYKKVLQNDSYGYSMSVGDIQENKEFQEGLAAALKYNQIVFVVSIEQVFFQN